MVNCSIRSDSMASLMDYVIESPFYDQKDGPLSRRDLSIVPTAICSTLSSDLPLRYACWFEHWFVMPAVRFMCKSTSISNVFSKNGERLICLETFGVVDLVCQTLA